MLFIGYNVCSHFSHVYPINVLGIYYILLRLLTAIITIIIIILKEFNFNKLISYGFWNFEVQRTVLRLFENITRMF